MKSVWLIGTTAVVGFGAMACTVGADIAKDGSSNLTSDAGVNVPTTDASTPNNVSPDSGPASSQKIGKISIITESGPPTLQPGSHIFMASFSDAPANAFCSYRQEGLCTVQSCAQANAYQKDAGVLTVSAKGNTFHPTYSASAGYGPFELLPTQPDPNTAPFQNFPGVFMPLGAGDTVTVTASGGDVPAFTVSQQIAPETTVTSPGGYVKSTTQGVSDTVPTIALNPALGFTTTWTPTTAFIRVVVGQSPKSGVGNRLATYCEVPGNSGTFTVPAAALSDFKPTAGTGPSSINVQTFLRSSVKAGAYDITFDTLSFAGVYGFTL